MAKAIAFLVLLIIAPAVYAATYTVGDTTGWTDGFNYDNWARPINFVVNDTLVFNFDSSSHAVDEVTQTAYNGCNTNGPISTSTSSPTTITLEAVGPRYFICPRSNHCSRGQKLLVNVRAASTTPGGSPPSTNGTTPSPPTETPATPGTPGTPSPPPPPSGGAAGVMGGRSSFMVGLSLVLAALAGLIV